MTEIVSSINNNKVNFYGLCVNLKKLWITVIHMSIPLFQNGCFMNRSLDE